MRELLNVPQVIRNLISSVENGETQKVQTVLDQGLSVESTDSDGNSLLHIAAAAGHEEIVRLLVIRGALLDRPNLYGWTALMQAARYGYENIVLHLLSSKAQVNIVNQMGVDALLLAVHGGYSKVVEVLLENGASIDCKETSQNFVTPLMVAARDGRDDVLRTLLRRSVPPDQRHCSTGWTPLMVTAMTGQLPMARLLVDKGADPNRKNLLGKTALAIASEGEMREIRGYLDRKTSDKPEKIDDRGISIVAAVKKGDYLKVKELLTNHKDECNTTTPDGATPLMYAAITGQTKIIQLLVEHGANVNAKDYENGWTALMQATYYGKVDAAKTLINLGADVSCRAKNNITAFDMALLINAPTSLFRMLAEHAMRNETVSAPGNTYNLGAGTDVPVAHGTTMAWQNTHTSLSQNDDFQRATSASFSRKSSINSMKKPSAIGKLARTFRNAFKTQNKVENFEDTLIVSGNDICNPPGDVHEGNDLTIVDPYSVTNHSAPKSRLPEDRLAVISPPFQESSDHKSHSTTDVSVDLKTSISGSLNSSGESSVSRSVVKPGKFLHGSGNAGGSATASNSPHSSGGASEVGHHFSDVGHSKEFHKQSSDRYSDTVLSKMAQMNQRRDTTTRSAKGKMQSSISADQLTSLETRPRRSHRRNGSKAESVASSRSTSSTLTPPKEPETPIRKKKLSVGKSGKHSSSRTRKTPPRQRAEIRKDDDLNDILQKLSLENYCPIFEKEEIDMETFLTMTNGDLNELGITHKTAREQILDAIDQVMEGKRRK